MSVRSFLPLWLAVAIGGPWLGCVTTAAHPCTKGGQPAHDDGKIGKGTKQCLQARESSGAYVNQGKYIEWYLNGQRALEGEYASGQKTGKWLEWDEQGKLLSEKWYEGGQLVPGREDHPYNGLGPPPRPVVKPSPVAPEPAPAPAPAATPAHASSALSK